MGQKRPRGRPRNPIPSALLQAKVRAPFLWRLREGWRKQGGGFGEYLTNLLERGLAEPQHPIARPPLRKPAPSNAVPDSLAALELGAHVLYERENELRRKGGDRAEGELLSIAVQYISGIVADKKATEAAVAKAKAAMQAKAAMNAKAEGPRR